MGVYLAWVLGGAALLAPAAMAIGAHLAAVHPGLDFLGGHPLHRYLSRLMLVLGLLGLWPALRWSGCTSLEALGLRWGPRSGWWFGVGTLSVAGLCWVLVVCELADGSRWVHSELGWLRVGRVVQSALVAALAVAFLEEWVFRGLLLGWMVRVTTWNRALAGSTMLYVWLHAQGQGVTAPLGMMWWDGFRELGHRLVAPFAGSTQMTATVNLCLLGWLLGNCRRWSLGLQIPMGIHAGLVFCAKLHSGLTQGTPGSGSIWWGSGKLVDGLAGTVGLIVLGMIWRLGVHRISRREDLQTVVDEVDVNGQNAA